MKWIDVREKLPENDKLVLAYIVEPVEIRGGIVGIVFAKYRKHRNFEWQAFGNYCTGKTKNDITHWCELPENPALEDRTG